MPFLECRTERKKRNVDTAGINETGKQKEPNKESFPLVSADAQTMDPTDTEGETGKGPSAAVLETTAEGKKAADGGGGAATHDRVLGDTWTLWLDNGGSRRTQEEYERGTVEIATVKTIREFWKFWNQLAPLMGPLEDKKHSSSSDDDGDRESEESKGVGGVERCNICVFREGVRPSWEDPANLHGGSWTLKVPRSAGDKVTSHVICEVIGRQLPVPRGVPGEEPICGVFVRVRGAVVAVDVWSRFTKPAEAIKTVKDHMDRLVAAMDIAGNVPPVVFTPHNSPSKPSSSTMARSASLLSASVNDLRSYTLSETDGSERPTPRHKGRAPPMLTSPRRIAVLVRPSKDDTPTSPASATTTPSSSTGSSEAASSTTPRFPYSGPTPRAATGGTRALNDHYRSASVGGGVAAAERHVLGPGAGAPQQAGAARDHVRRPSGLQEALPILLRQGYAIPFAAYKDLAQAEALAAVPPGSSEAQRCEEHLRQSSQSHARGSPMLPALPLDLLSHRRAYSLDRTALDEAYARYTQAKHDAYLRDLGVAEPHAASPLCAAQEWDESLGQEPIPGLGPSSDATGLFGGLRNASVPRSSLASTAFSGEQGPFERLCGSCTATTPEPAENNESDDDEESEDDESTVSAEGTEQEEVPTHEETEEDEKGAASPEVDTRAAALVAAVLLLVTLALVLAVATHPPLALD